MLKIKLLWHYVMLFCIVASACSKMEDTHLKYAGDGEITYVSKVDSIYVIPGKNRVLLSWGMGIDATAERAVVYWNDGEDSVEVPMDRAQGQDSVSVLIEDLTEGNYTFDVVTYDKLGNHSIKTSQFAAVYGDRYRTGLQNRKFRSALIKDPDVEIAWYASLEDGVGTEIKYTDGDGKERIIFVEPDDVSFVLENPKSDIMYRSFYAPNYNSLDTFATDFEILQPENLLEKSKFRRWNPIGIPYREYLPHLNLFAIEHLWDDVYTGIGYIYLEYSPLPDTSDFTFDMGVTAKLERLRYHMDTGGNLYQNGNVKRFQVWGSPTPEVTDDLTDWTFLGDFTSYKPSGLPPGQNTAADATYAQAGENFTFEADAPPVRYIRILVLETWTPVVAHMTELTFWGDLVK